MNRLPRQLAVLTAILAVLIVADHWLGERQAAARIQASQLSLLVEPDAEIVPERVRKIDVRAGSRQWIFEKRGNHWRFPAYHGAYVQENRVTFLLESLLTTYGTVVGDDEDDRDEYGLTPSSAVRVALSDGSVALADFWVGRGAPGPRAGESYVRREGDNAIIHLHANPRHALASGDPPMVDGLVLPAALAGKSVVQVNFATQELAPRQLRRVDKPPPTEGPYLPKPGEYSYDWIAGFGERVDTCLIANVFAYTSFVSSLRFQRLHDPRARDYGFTDGERIELVDEDGDAVILHRGRQEGNSVYLRNASAGLVCSVPATAADLLFPTREVLTDTLPEPSPYRLGQR